MPQNLPARKTRNIARAPNVATFARHPPPGMHSSTNSEIAIFPKRRALHVASEALPNSYHLLYGTCAWALTVQVTSNSTLQFSRSLPKDCRQVLQVITSGIAELAHEVLCGAFQVSIILTAFLLLGTAKVCVRRDGCCAFETLESLLRFGLCVWIESPLSEELI
jgi:hypothetical protein